MAPEPSDDEPDDRRQDVYDESEVPRDASVGTSPEEPGFDVVFDITAVICRVGFVPEEMDE